MIKRADALKFARERKHQHHWMGGDDTRLLNREPKQYLAMLPRPASSGLVSSFRAEIHLYEQLFKHSIIPSIRASVCSLSIVPILLGKKILGYSSSLVYQWITGNWRRVLVQDGYTEIRTGRLSNKQTQLTTPVIGAPEAHQAILACCKAP